MKPRHGAISSTLLSVAAALGLGAAGLSMVTGVTPCSLMSACDADAKAPAAVTVADAEAMKADACETKAACDDAKAPVAATVADRSEAATACNDAPKSVAVSAKACDSTKSSDCGAAATTVAATSDCGDKAMTVAAQKDCGDQAAKGACGAEAMTVAARSDAACEGEAKAVNASNVAADCGSKSDCGAAAVAASDGACASKDDCGGEAVMVAASGAGCEGEKEACEDGVKAIAVADSDACGGECTEGDVKALPVAVTAFNAECPYSHNSVKANVVSAYNGMNVRFCCAGCKMRFEKADDAERAKLVAGVVKPINSACCGKPVDAATVSVVQGFPVAFCKSACAEMVRSADAQKQMNFVASKINYVNADCCGKPTAEAKLVGFHEGKAVAFNGSGCAEKFNAMNDAEKNAYVLKVSSGMPEPCGDKKCADEGCDAAA